jgi:hypothetical protein
MARLGGNFEVCCGNTRGRIREEKDPAELISPHTICNNSIVRKIFLTVLKP